MSMTVGIEELQVGMFVHLDLGWWAHPFALSSFVVSTPEQISTIRGLGLKTLRWSPEKSRLVAPDAAVAPATPAPPAAAVAADAVATPVAATLNPTATGPDEGPVTIALTAAAAASLIGQAVRASDDTADRAADRAADAQATAEPHPARKAHGAAPLAPRSPLATQRAALQLCEQQYGEAGTAWREAQRQLPKAPDQALAITQGLTRALLDKMMVDREMCVRVLGDVAADPVSGHALNVTVISLLMARVFGFEAAEMEDIGIGALLHDVGKLDLPERARHDGATLDQADHKLYRDHVALGVAQGQRMGLSEGALTVLAQHHEMADGSGFPARMGLDRMSTAARIVALVNRYDKLCNPPQAALAMTPHEALSLIFAQSRGKFDGTMLNAFIRMMGVYPPGSIVQLTDDRYASVVSVNSSRPLKPRVMVCDTSVPLDEALLLNLDGHADLGIRRSMKPGQLPAAARDYLSPRPRTVYFFEPVQLDMAHAAQDLAA